MCEYARALASPKLHDPHDDDDIAAGKQAMFGPQSWRHFVPESNQIMPQFLVSPKNGFLPRQDPLQVLPERFAKLEDLLQRMPRTRRDGSAGLLATGDFGKAIEKELPLYDVDDVTDSRLLAALYRDYTFAASAYLLEPCDMRWRQEKQYGLGRDRLPKQIAVPLSKVAAKIGAKPFMEYALSYALYNWRRIDPYGPIDFDNLQLIRAFSGTESERGFILVHVAMVRYSGDLVRSTLDTIDGAVTQDRTAFNCALQNLFSCLWNVNRVMETMWVRSKPSSYEEFRAYIMGIKNQPMFPNGVIYEGVSDEPQFYRGESGANDSMIPTIDNLLQLTESLPDNPLTQILRDFRSYRPSNHSEFVQWVQDEANRLGIRFFAELDHISAAWYLKCVDLVRNFRQRHWNFTKEYILKYSDHPVATGGSPIVTWLPNQLRAVLQIMHDIATKIPEASLPDPLRTDFVDIRDHVTEQIAVLDLEVVDLRKRFPDQERFAVA